jgi:hypothetical protein
MRRMVTVVGVVGLVLWGATSPKAQTTPPVPTATPESEAQSSAGAAQRTMGQGKTFSIPSGDDPWGMANRGDEAFVNCAGCSMVSGPLMKRGAEVLKSLTEKQTLPASLVRLSSAEINALLRGKSWSSAVLAGPFGKEYQRLLAFDADGRGRWLNFHGGIKGYSTLCEYKVDEDLLCLSCSGSGPAQCSAVYREGDFVMAYDEEQGQLEIYDWIMKSRWEDERFLAPH